VAAYLVQETMVKLYRLWPQAALGRLTPIEYDAIMTTPASQAA
jgi:hypothetical protein